MARIYELILQKIVSSNWSSAHQVFLIYELIKIAQEKNPNP